MDDAIDGVVADPVGAAVRIAAFDAGAGEPHRVAVDVMVAAQTLARLAHRRAAELAAPDHQRVVEHAAALQVPDEGGAGAIDLARDRVDRCFEIEWPAVM